MGGDEEATNLILQDLSEIVGVLHDIDSEGLIIKCAGRDIRISAPPILKRKAAKLVGKKVAVFRIGRMFYMRKVKDNSSVAEKLFNAEKTVEVRSP